MLGKLEIRTDLLVSIHRIDELTQSTLFRKTEFVLYILVSNSPVFIPTFYFFIDYKFLKKYAMKILENRTVAVI